MKGEKIYIVTQESMVDGEILFNVVPCSTLEKAKKVMEEEKETLLMESNHYNGYDPEELEETFEIEEGEERWFINDPFDDYYEEIKIIEEEII
jgi:hypothetical protein